MAAKQYNPLYKHMFNDLLKDGSSTYSFEGKRDKGIAVGGYSKTKHHIEAKNLSEKDLLWYTNIVRRVVEEYTHLLELQTYYVSTHVDTELNTLFIDIVRVFNNNESAFEAGRNNKQRLVYDIEDKRYLFIPPIEDCHRQLYDEMGC